MDVKILEVLEAVRGTMPWGVPQSIAIKKISTDTRTVEKGDLFFALSGVHYDGHDFIGEAIAKGALVSVISDIKKISEEWKQKHSFILVDDVLTAYGDLAKYWRRRFRIPVVAITGSVGKTTVKELLAHLASTKMKVLKNRGTENNLVGVPKTLLQLDETHGVVVMEMGTNQPGEIRRLTEIINPQIAVITLIGHSHLEGLVSLEGVQQEKLSLLQHLERGGLLILNGEDPMLSEVESGIHKIIRVGVQNKDNDVVAENIWCHEKGISFRLAGDVIFESSLMGRHNVINVLLAFSACTALGIDLKAAGLALREFKPVPGRLNMKTIDGIGLIDDTYNSNPSSFRAALEMLKDFKTRGKKGVVFGDMLELGGQSEALHREVGALLAESLFDFVIAVGPLSEWAVEEALEKGYSASKIFKVSDSCEAAKLCRLQVTEGDMVLVKGSRGMKMERVFECFTISSTR